MLVYITAVSLNVQYRLSKSKVHCTLCAFCANHFWGKIIIRHKIKSLQSFFCCLPSSLKIKIKNFPASVVTFLFLCRAVWFFEMLITTRCNIQAEIVAENGWNMCRCRQSRGESGFAYFEFVKGACLSCVVKVLSSSLMIIKNCWAIQIYMTHA